MATQQGDIAILNTPVAQELLSSSIPARLAYVWTDGTPRVIPIWFHWNGKEIVCGTPPNAAKLKAIKDGTKIAVSIDSRDYPYKVLQIRGTVRIETVDDGVSTEYAAAAVRYRGEEVGKEWVEQMRSMSNKMINLVITPNWVGMMDFEARFPNAIEELMAAGQ